MRVRLAGILVLFALAAPGAAGEPVDAAPVRYEDARPQRPSVEERLEEIRRRIQAALEYPPIASRREVTGEALVRFEIASDGRPHDVAVARSSGRPLLDRAATRAVLSAGVLPWVVGPLEIPVRFQIEPGDGLSPRVPPRTAP